MQWWETDCADELPAYIRKLEDENERLEGQVAKLKEAPEARKSEIIFAFFSCCRASLEPDEIAFLVLKLAGFSYHEMGRISFSSSSSTIHRKVTSAKIKLSAQLGFGLPSQNEN